MVTRPRSPDLLKSPTARTLVAGDLEAVFLPDHGMLGASLRHRGVEILRRIEDLGAAAARGSSAGIPLLYPWANRLAEPRYRVLGQEVVLDKSSPLLHFDEHGLPMHGVPWPLLSWIVTEARQDFTAAQLEWSTSNLLAVFGYAQIFAPKDKDFIAFEPMTAPTSALTSGRGLRFVSPGERFRAVFRIRIDGSNAADAQLIEKQD